MAGGLYGFGLYIISCRMKVTMMVMISIGHKIFILPLIFFSACLFLLLWSSAILAGEQRWQRRLRAGVSTTLSKGFAGRKSSILLDSMCLALRASDTAPLAPQLVTLVTLP